MNEKVQKKAKKKEASLLVEASIVKLTIQSKLAWFQVIIFFLSVSMYLLILFKKNILFITEKKKERKKEASLQTGP